MHKAARTDCATDKRQLLSRVRTYIARQPSKCTREARRVIVLGALGGSSDLTHTCSGVIKCSGQAWTPTRHSPASLLPLLPTRSGIRPVLAQGAKQIASHTYALHERRTGGVGHSLR